MQPTNRDADQLNLLATFQYIWAGFQALTGLIGLGFVGLGLFVATNPQIAQWRNAPPPWFTGLFGAVFAGIGGLFFLSFEAVAVLTFLAGRFLSTRRHYTFCFVIAALDCIYLPFGTALGVFTILVLLRPSVKQLFPGATAPPPPSS